MDCSRFNHSCYPNSEVYYSEPYLRVFAVKEIMEGEEICFSYKGDTFLGTNDLSDDTPPSIEAMREAMKSEKYVPKFRCFCWLCTSEDQEKLDQLNNYRIKFWKLEKRFYRTKPPSQEYLKIGRELLEHINSGDSLHISWTDFYARKGMSAALLANNHDHARFFLNEYSKVVKIRRSEDSLSAKMANDYSKLYNVEGLMESLELGELENASFYQEVLKQMHHT